jgi:hypothetical protein
MKLEETLKGKGKIMEKQGKNVIAVREEGEFIIQTRSIQRKGMNGAKVYELKVPKTLDAAKRVYSEKYVLAAFIATLKTDSDDKQVPTSGGLAPEIKERAKAIASASPDVQAKIAAILEADKLAKEKAATSSTITNGVSKEAPKEVKEAKKGK